jgi:hypothetical protein
MVAKKTLALALDTSEVSATMISRFDAPRALRNSSIEDNEDDNLTIKNQEAACL